MKQSQFIAFREDMAGSGPQHEETDLGVITLDSWLVALKGQIEYIDSPGAGKSQIFSVGLKTQPTTIPGRWDVEGAVNYDDLFEDYLGDTLEALAVFGSAIKMPLFYMLCPPAYFTDGDIIIFKKIFRKGIYSGDNLTLYMNVRQLEGVADTELQIGMAAQLKQVISPHRW